MIGRVAEEMRGRYIINTFQYGQVKAVPSSPVSAVDCGMSPRTATIAASGHRVDIR